MKTQNIIAICWLLVLTTSVHAYDLDSIYDVLDREIALADEYVGMKEQHLSTKSTARTTIGWRNVPWLNAWTCRERWAMQHAKPLPCASWLIRIR